MSWETRRKGRFYYRKEWRAGHCVSVFVGSGETAELLSQFDLERRTELNQERAEERRLLKLCQSSDEAANALTARIEALVKAVLQAAGCHQHKGTWRRRRMPKAKKEEALSKPLEEMTTAELYRCARQPGAEARTIHLAIDAIERDGWIKISEEGDLMKIATNELLTRMSGKENPLTLEILRRNCQRLTQELTQPGDGTFEEMLIRHVVLSWLRLAAAEREYQQNLSGSHTHAAGLYWEKRLTSAQKRYLKACESLARVRKLLRPAGPQVNVEQINAVVGGFASAGLRKARRERLSSEPT